jgi:homocysteine S-methyltransferase
MSRYRTALPQLKGETFVTDGGMETTFVFHDGIDLPDFAAIVLRSTPEGRAHLRDYYERYLTLSRPFSGGFILDLPTWRASSDWGRRLGYDAAALRAVHEQAADMLVDLRDRHETDDRPIVVNGVIGPRGDGYRSEAVPVEEAATYHGAQVRTIAGTACDLVTAYTLGSIGEAAGIAVAAREADMPVALSFTVETDGRLVTGPTLREAIETVDELTGGYPAYYLVNCAHPSHFASELDQAAAWLDRILGIRANASTRSHAELDEATEIDAGDPVDLGRRYRDLSRRMPRLRIFGGCCGTDHRHVAAICDAVLDRRYAA